MELPNPAPAAANYVPFLLRGRHVFISGQLPLWNGEVRWIGKIGRDYTVEDGQRAARLAGLNVLAQLSAALVGQFNRVSHCLRVCGFVNCTETFDQHAFVLNGASDLMIEVFGERGRHTRCAVGANALPRGVAVEVEAVFEIDA